MQDYGNGSLIKNDFFKNNSLKYTYNCVNVRGTYEDLQNGESTSYIIDFDGFIAVIAGLGCLWIIVMYTISVGFRLFQLAFLQLIAPLPIMMYLEPKDDGPFQKWIKQCIGCYLDYFIRTAIMYFIILIIKTIMDSNTSYFFKTLGSITDKEKTYIIIIIIFALLMFAKKIPDLLKDILPTSSGFSDYGFSFKNLAAGMVGGALITKGYDKVKGFAGHTAKGIGLMPLNTGKKIISGIDSAQHGKGFWNGFTKNPGQMRQWINKQRETLTPEAYKASQERREGRENVSAINDKWNSGVKIARKLMNQGFSEATGSKPWTKALDGTNIANYELVFKHKKFADSKFAVDQASKVEEELRYAKEALDMGAATVTANGLTYTNADAHALVEALDKQQKKLKGLESVHTEISKQFQDDARTENEFKFIKNNPSNPANTRDNHASRGIE